MHSKYPWTVSLCSGGALQFLIMDANGNIVLLGEMYNEDDLVALLNVFQRNPEIRVADVEGFSDTLLKRKYKNAEDYLDSLVPSAAMKLLRENNYDVIKAAEASKAEMDAATKKKDETPS